MSKWADLPRLVSLASHDKVFIHWKFFHYLLGALGLCAASNALSPGAVFAGVRYPCAAQVGSLSRRRRSPLSPTCGCVDFDHPLM